MLNRVNQGLCSLPEVVKWICEGPAEVHGIVGKGRLRPGYDADLVLVDMNAERTVGDSPLFTKCGWSPYEGMRIKGWPVMTLVHGQVVYRDGEIVEGVRGQALRYAPEWELE